MLGGVNNQLFFMSLAGFPVVLFLIFILKWATTPGRSLIARKPVAGNEDD